MVRLDEYSNTHTPMRKNQTSFMIQHDVTGEEFKEVSREVFEMASLSNVNFAKQSAFLLIDHRVHNEKTMRDIAMIEYRW